MRSFLVQIPAIFLLLSVAHGQVVTYNPSNGALSIDTTGGVGAPGFNLVSLKIPGPQAVSIDRWSDNTSQDGIDTWIQSFTTNTQNGVSAEQWIGLSGGGNGAPDAAVPPGVYQVATYQSGLSLSAFSGDPLAPGTTDDDIGVGQVQIGGWASNSVPGTNVLVSIDIATVGGLACDFVAPDGCDILDLDALYAGSNGSPAPLTSQLIGDWLGQASASSNPAKLDAGHNYVFGDVDLSGSVDSTDLGLLLNNFSDSTGLGWARGNLNPDGVVDSTDLGLLLNNFGFTTASSTAVPEPSGNSIVMSFAFALMLLIAKYRRTP